MKVVFNEYDGVFAIELEAENLQDAATLTRFGMNRTNAVEHCSTYVAQSGSFTSSIQFGKSKNSNNDVPKRK